MSYACEICGKKSVYGISQMHKRGVAGKRWKKRAQETKRMFKPNLQKATLTIDSEKISLRLCTKCLKRSKMGSKLA